MRPPGRKPQSRDEKAERRLLATIRLRSLSRLPDPEYWPICPICQSRDSMRIESWARWPSCSQPACTYARAVARRDVERWRANPDARASVDDQS